MKATLILIALVAFNTFFMTDTHRMIVERHNKEVLASMPKYKPAVSAVHLYAQALEGENALQEVAGYPLPIPSFKH